MKSVDKIKEAIADSCTGCFIEVAIIVACIIVVSFTSCASKKVSGYKKSSSIEVSNGIHLQERQSVKNSLSYYLDRDSSLTWLVLVRTYYDNTDSVPKVKQVDSLSLINQRITDREGTTETTETDALKDSVDSQSVIEKVSEEEYKEEKMNESFYYIRKIIQASAVMAALFVFLWIRKKLKH